MADGPQRLRFGPTNADCWRHETVEGHIPAPVTTRRTRRRNPSPLDQTLDGHHSVPVTTRRRDSLPSNQTPDGFLHPLTYHNKGNAEEPKQSTQVNLHYRSHLLGMMLLQRKNEMLVLGPTGNSASNVQGSTIYTGLDIAVPRRRKRGPSARVKALWTNKTIDEISMVSSKPLHSINLQSNVIKNLDCNSTAVFGGLHVVIVLGDFHQFPPIQAKALWQKQESNDEKEGQLLWYLFQNVVLLDEQMRQQSDPAYHAVLKRARDGTLTQTDVDLLNTRVVTSLESPPDRVNKCVVRANKLRHLIIRQQIDTFARSRQQKVIIFPGRHTRWRKANGGLLTKSWRYKIAPR